MISHIEMDFKGGGLTASLIALALAQHFLPEKSKDQGSPKFLAGST